MYTGFDESLDVFAQELAVLNLELEEVLENGDVPGLSEVQAKALNLRKRVEESYCFAKHSIFVNLRHSFGRNQLKAAKKREPGVSP
mmetsp:Transcript_33515/g.38480  ORF Transcript_33515/g.38480 Transcript_33515/m.38480 type:complete len:86 (+) Transcript_33515:262-519(+)